MRPKIGHESPEVEYKCSCTLSLTPALDGGVGGQGHVLAALPPGKRRGTPFTRG